MGNSQDHSPEMKEGGAAIVNTAYKIYQKSKRRKLQHSILSPNVGITMKGSYDSKLIPPFWRLSQFMKKETEKKHELDSLNFPISFDHKEAEDIQPLFYGDLITLQVEDKYSIKRDLILDNLMDKRIVAKKREGEDYIDGMKLFRILPAISSDSQNKQQKEIDARSENKDGIIKKDDSSEKKKAEKARNEYEKSKGVYGKYIGTPVKFENKIQLVNEVTHQYLSTGKYETLEKRNGKKTIIYRSNLSVYGSSNTHFQFLPKFPAQMDQGQMILNNHSVKLAADEPNNPLGILFPAFFSKFEQEKNQSLFFARKDSDVYFKFEVVRPFNLIGEKNIIYKPIRIEHETKTTCLQPQGKDDNKICFKEDMTTWEGFWQIIEPKEKALETKKVFIRHFLSNQFLSITKFVDGRPQYAELSPYPYPFVISQGDGKSLFKIYFEKRKLCFNFTDEKGQIITQREDYFPQEDIDNMNDSFRFTEVPEIELSEMLFCKDMKQQLKYLQEGIHKYSLHSEEIYKEELSLTEKGAENHNKELDQYIDMKFPICVQLLVFLYQYLMNIKEEIVNEKYPKNYPIPYRQDAIYNSGIIDYIILLHKSIDKKRFRGEEIEEKCSIPLSFVVVQILKNLLLKNKAVKKHMFYRYKQIFELILYYGEIKIFFSIYKNISIQDFQERAQYFQSKKDIEKNVKELIVEIKIQNFSKENIRLLRKIISTKVIDNYRIIFNDRDSAIAEDVIESEEEKDSPHKLKQKRPLKTKNMKLISISQDNKEYVATFASQDMQLALEEIKLLSFILRLNREEKIDFFQRMFDTANVQIASGLLVVPNIPKDKINVILSAINNPKTDEILKASLLHLISICFIDCPENKKNTLHKCFQNGSFKEERPFKINPFPETEDIKIIWNLLISVLSNSKIEGNTNLHIYIETLRCGKALLKRNLEWKLGLEDLKKYFFEIFKIMLYIFKIKFDFHKSANLRLTTVKLDKDLANINFAITSSFSTILHQVNLSERETNTEKKYFQKQIGKLEKLICENFIFFHQAREYSYLCNAAHYFIQKTTTDKTPEEQFNELVQEQSTILPGSTFVQSGLHPFLSEDLSNYYNQFIHKSQPAMDFAKDETKRKGEKIVKREAEDFTLEEHLVMLFNRTAPEKKVKKMNAHNCVLNLFKQRIIFLRNLECMEILTEEEEKKYLKAKDTCNSLKQYLKKYILQNGELDDISKDELINFINSIFNDHLKDPKEKKMFLLAFRQCKSYYHIINFLKKNLYDFITYKKGGYIDLIEKKKANYYNTVFDLCCQLLIVYCHNQKAHQNDLWSYLHFFLTLEIPIQEINYELELVYEICKGNGKLASTYTLNESFNILQTKANKLFKSETVQKKSAKTIAKIYLEILEYDKLFPRALWFFKLYKYIYGSINFHDAEDCDDVVIFVGLMRYLNTKLNMKVEVIVDEDPRNIFIPGNMFDLLKKFIKDLDKIEKDEYQIYLDKIINSLFRIYYKMYVPRKLSKIKVDESEFLNNFSFDTLSHDLIDFINTENLNINSEKVNEKLFIIFFDLIQFKTIDERTKTQNKERWDQIHLKYQPLSDTPSQIKAEQTSFVGNSKTELNQIILNKWKINILSDEKGYVIEEINQIAKIFKSFVDEYIQAAQDTKKSQSLECLGYLEFLHNSIKMYSGSAIFEVEPYQKYNLRFFLILLISLFKIYEKKLLAKKINATDHQRVTSIFIDLGVMKMCFKLLTELHQSQLPITESLIFSLMKHLMYGKGTKGQDELLKIFKNHEETEIIFKRICQVLNYNTISISDYNKYKIYRKNFIVSKASYKLKLDLVKNIFGFLKIAADKNHTGFQDYFRSQDNIDQNYNMIKKSVSFLDRILQTKRFIDEDKTPFIAEGERVDEKAKSSSTFYLAQFPLRAILEFIQGPNIDNLNEILHNGFLNISERVYSDLRIKNQGNFSMRSNPKKDNHAIMKLKYFVTKILKDVLQNLKKQEILSIFGKLLSSSMIYFNLNDYAYLYACEHKIKYEMELFFHYIKSDLEDSSFILEVGFELVFLLNIYDDYSAQQVKNKDIQIILGKRKNENPSLFDSLNRWLYTKFQAILFCWGKIDAEIIKEFESNSNEEGKITEVKNTTKDSVRKIMNTVLGKYTASVEVVIDDNKKTLYFSHLPYKNFLQDKEKKEFEDEINFSSNVSRTEGLLRNAPSMLHSIKIRYEVTNAIKKIFLLNFLFLSSKYLTFLTMLLAIIINVLLLFSDTINSEIISVENKASSSYNISAYILGVLLTCCLALILVNSASERFPYLWIKSRYKNWDSLNMEREIKLSFGQSLLQWIRLFFKEFDFIYYLSVFICCFLGLFVHFFFFSYSLTLLMVPLEIVRNLLRAIIGPIIPIGLTLIIYLIVVFVFTLIASYSYKKYFPNEECSELLKCYAVILDQTFKTGGALSGYLNSTYDEGPDFLFSRIVYDFLYAFIIGELFIQMISGIVIDKFGSMREEIDTRREQFNSECFICGKDRGSLETETKKGFHYHTKIEHNLWNYISFIGYLNEKPEYELDSDEWYIFDLINQRSISWFPSQEEVSQIRQLSLRFQNVK